MRTVLLELSKAEIAKLQQCIVAASADEQTGKLATEDALKLWGKLERAALDNRSPMGQAKAQVQAQILRGA